MAGKTLGKTFIFCISSVLKYLFFLNSDIFNFNYSIVSNNDDNVNLKNIFVKKFKYEKFSSKLKV